METECTHAHDGHAACSLKQCGDRTYYCAVELALQVIGGKWKPIILWRLHGRQPLRFSELMRMVPNVTQKMLTQQLRELETDGLVWRKVFAQVPPRVEYGLTELGVSVLPVLEQLSRWGREFEVEYARREGAALAEAAAEEEG